LGYRRLLDDGAGADDPGLRASAHDAARHVGAGDRPEPRDPEELANLRLAERLLGLDRSEHADEGLLDVLRELVDDAVAADVDALALGERPRLGARAHVEADAAGVRDRGEADV